MIKWNDPSWAHINNATVPAFQLLASLPPWLFWLWQKVQIVKLSDLLSTRMQRGPTESQILQDYISEREQEESETLQAKKRFLKESILDVYIREEEQIDRFLDFFLLYVRRAKGIDTQEHNLELLSLTELKELVAEFRSLHPPAEQTTVIDVESSLDMSMSRMEGMVQNFDAQRVFYSNGSWDYELEGYEECKKVKPFFAVEDGYRNIVVIFEKQEIRKVGGFFGIGAKAELWIEMRANICREHTTRRVEDFIALRGLLSRSFPFAFIHPLEINEKQLQRVGEEGVRGAVVAECRRFINYVCRNEQLLQCFYTHRFFKENNFQAFLSNHKSQRETANRIKALENAEGCVQIEISDKNELVKRDYVRKSGLLEQIYAKFDESNTRIAGKVREVQAEIQKQREQLQRAILEFTNVNPLLKTKVYEGVVGAMVSYSELFKNYEESLNHFHCLFESLNLQLASQAKKTWGFFSRYAKDIAALSEEYHVRRKVFLEKEARKEGGDRAKEQKSPGEERQRAQLDPVNRSIISNLGIANSVKETVWIERFSKWQGYVNKQFTGSFERLLEQDVDTLRAILRENIANRQEMQRKEEALIRTLQATL